MTKKMKTVSIVVAAVLIAAIIGVSIWLMVYYIPEGKQAKVFKADMAASTIFANDMDSRVPQTKAYSIMKEHFENNTSGKTPMLLFVGYDGCTANMLQKNYDNPDSAVRAVSENGTCLIGYAGGAKKGDQATSTAPGWASIFTGVWATENGVKGNDDILNESTRSIIYELGASGKASSYSVSWDTHITTTYSKEVASAKANSYPITYTVSDDDSGTIDAVVASINRGDRGVFCTLEYPDHTGHGDGFDFTSDDYMQAYLDAEAAANRMIAAVKARDTYASEDWMIMIASDHGGCVHGHGARSIMESTTFIVVNKVVA